jgi:hypothetical protein
MKRDVFFARSHAKAERREREKESVFGALDDGV